MTIPDLFDAAQLARQSERAKAHFAKHRFLHDAAIRSLVQRLQILSKQPQTIHILGEADSVLEAAIKTAFNDSTISYLELQNERLVCEPETLECLVSLFTLHKINDLPGLLIQTRKALKPDGVLFAVFPGDETLFELRQAMLEAETTLTGGISPRLHPVITKQQMGALLQRAGFALPVVDSDMVHVDYRAFSSLLHDLRYMGEGNALSKRLRRFSPRALFTLTEKLYRKNFANDAGLLPATFELVHAVGWAPHESQPKPLPRGSAKISLIDILEKE